jgi:hypothetical protein
MIVGSAVAMTLAAFQAARAEPVVYTAYVITDGQLAGKAFSGAQVTMQFRGDTANVLTTIENGATVYRNNAGRTVMFITQGAQTQVVHIAPHQLYVRYDPLNGVIGFGSFAVGPTYPIKLGCSFDAACEPNVIGTSGFPEGQSVSALQDVLNTPTDAPYYSADVLAQETNLQGPTVLGGYLVACVAYDFVVGRCPSIPASAITTDQGDLYFQGQLSVGKGIFSAVVGGRDDD